MVEVIWAEPALSDLNSIAEYIALDKPIAASKFVQKVFDQVELIGSIPNTRQRLPYC